MPKTVDLAVVGAGPCGLAAGIAAKRAGLHAVLFDRGCLVQTIMEYPTYLTFFSTPERLEIADIPFVISDAKPTRREALSYYRAVADRYELNIRQYEEVSHINRSKDHFQLSTRTHAGEELETEANAIVLATGAMSEANKLDVPGGDSEKVLHAFRESHPYYNQEVMVVGGGNSAVEAALALHRGGGRVTVVHFENEFDRGVKPWILPDILNRIEAGDIQACWGARVIEVFSDRVVLQSEGDGSTEILDNDWVLAMTGWRPDHTLLHGLGVRTDPSTGIPDHNPRTMATNVPGIFVAGVLTAGFNANKIFIENGRHHGELIAQALTPAS